MSADNWAVCPKCSHDLEINLDNIRDKLERQYGKVSLSEYCTIVAELDRLENVDLDYTLREDYEIRTTERGIFSVNYRCYCTKCEFEYRYEYNIKVL